jgi:hypothetical protein
MEIIIYALIILMNIPAALKVKEFNRRLAWFAIGYSISFLIFQIGLK